MRRDSSSWLVALGGCLLVGALAAVGLARSAGAAPAKDFSLFYEAGRQWVVSGEPLGLAWYHPFAFRFFGLIAWFPSPVAAGIWVALNVAGLVGSAYLIGRHWSDANPVRPWWQRELTVLVVMGVPWFIEFYVNQFVPTILLLLLLAERAMARRRDGVAGLWLGLAILLKLSPALLLLWLLLRRRYRTIATASAAVLLAGPGLDVLTEGWQRGLAWQWEWLGRLRWSGSTWTVLFTGGQCDYFNHSVVAVLRRLLHPTDSTPHFDVDLGGPAQLASPPSAQWLDLPLPVVAGIWVAFSSLALGALIAASLRRDDSPSCRRWEFALWCFAMLWFLPVVRQYHAVFAVPLASLLVHRLRHRSAVEPGWARSPGAVGLAVWLLASVASAPRLLQEIGVPTLGFTALGVAGLLELASLRREQRSRRTTGSPSAPATAAAGRSPVDRGSALPRRSLERR